MAHPIDRTDDILDWDRKWKNDYEPDTVTLETALSLKFEGSQKPYSLPVSTKVPMDIDEFGLEHLLLKTLPAFMKHTAKVNDKVESSQGSKSPLEGKKKWDLWAECLEGETLRFWNIVLDEKYPETSDRTGKKFKTALNWLIRHITGTLEHHNSGDSIYWQLAHRKKKATESPRDYLVRFQEFLKVAKLCDNKEQRPDDKKCLGWFYCAMPANYRKQFTLMSQKNLYEYDLDELCDWMTKLARTDSYVIQSQSSSRS